MLILKIVKVLCFHTLLQVLILNVVRQGPIRWRLKASLSSSLHCWTLLLRLDSSNEKLIAISLRHPPVPWTMTDPKKSD